MLDLRVREVGLLMAGVMVLMFGGQGVPLFWQTGKTPIMRYQNYLCGLYSGTGNYLYGDS